MEISDINASFDRSIAFRPYICNHTIITLPLSGGDHALKSILMEHFNVCGHIRGFSRRRLMDVGVVGFTIYFVDYFHSCMNVITLYQNYFPSKLKGVSLQKSMSMETII